MPRLTIDFVSDVSCPWCAIGLRGLQIALERVGELVAAEIRFHPYELNPDMAAGGENAADHVARKYGASPDAASRSRAAIREQAAALGLEMTGSDAARIWNTFDAHRLLHWAGLEGRQLALASALFRAHFAGAISLADHAALAGVAAEVGLDAEVARDVLASERYADAVRDDERRWLAEGVRGVPYIVINDRYVINGGQPSEKFERALRHIAAEVSAATIPASAAIDAEGPTL